MEYREKYKVRRKIHMRPLISVMNAVKYLRKENKGLEMVLENNLGKTWDYESILSLLSSNMGFDIKGEVTVIAKGNYPQDKLKEFTDEVGNIFSTEIENDYTMRERLHYEMYGHYPEE